MSSSLPKISIVVPNFNGAATLPAALDSLLAQNFAGLEILVADGGSTDGSVEVIKKYAPHLAWWESAKDRGQTHALNKGFAHASGDVVNWLCSDDRLTTGALEKIGATFAAQPELDVLAGACRVLYTNEPLPGTASGCREWIWTPDAERFRLLPCANPIPQPSCFFRRKLLDRRPPLDESYQYALDFELWNYFLSKQARFETTPDILSIFVQSGTNKSSHSGDKPASERERVYRTYVKERVSLAWWHRSFRHPLEKMRKRSAGWLGRRFAKTAQRALDFGLAPFYGLERVRAMDWRDIA